jgi:hypothetical protein
MNGHALARGRAWVKQQLSPNHYPSASVQERRRKGQSLEITVELFSETVFKFSLRIPVTTHGKSVNMPNSEWNSTLVVSYGIGNNDMSGTMI